MVIIFLLVGVSLSVFGVNVNWIIVCNDSIVSVSGMFNMVVIIGYCISFIVFGMRNLVIVDFVDIIEVVGFNNEVMYYLGLLKISNVGGFNSV